MPDREMRRYRQAFHPERALDLLVPEMPEVNLPACSGALLIRGPSCLEMDPGSAVHRRRGAAPRPGHERNRRSPDRSLCDQVQETNATISAGVCGNIVGTISGAAGNSLTAGCSSAVMPAFSLVSTHCQRPRVSSADLLAGAYSTTANPRPSAS